MPRAEVKAVIGHETVSTAQVVEGLDLQPGMDGQLIEICILADDTPLDQNPFSADPDLVASSLGRGDQRRGEQVAQAIELHRWTGLAYPRPVVVL